MVEASHPERLADYFTVIGTGNDIKTMSTSSERKPNFLIINLEFR